MITRSAHFIFIASILSILGLSHARAIDPIDENDSQVRWTAGFRESDVGVIDRLRIDWLSGTTFAEPFFMNFDVLPPDAPVADPGGWAISFGSAREAEAGSLTGTDRLAFEIVFLQPQTDPLGFLFRAWEGETLRDLTRVDWSGERWSTADVGACCLGTECRLVTDAECADLGGQFLGAGIDCAPTLCTQSTPAVTPTWGQLKSLFR